MSSTSTAHIECIHIHVCKTLIYIIFLKSSQERLERNDLRGMAHEFTAFSPWSLGEAQHHGLGRAKGFTHGCRKQRDSG